MTSGLRRFLLQVTVPVLCGLIGLNAYLVSRNLKLIHNNAIRRVQASNTQSDITNAVLALEEMETGQRGYLLTGDPSYVQPYQEAHERLAVHFADLRSTLTGKDLSLETHLESVAEAKITEMNETIRLRERGYRHRAFVIVSSNRGQELMNDARTTLGALSLAQSSKVARYDRELRESISNAVRESALASGILLIVTVVTFLAFNRYRNSLEGAVARQSGELQAASLQLGRLTSMNDNFRGLLGQMRAHANNLLEVYGGFLPRQAQEKVEHIEGAAGQMIGFLDDAATNPVSENSVEAVEVRPPERLSA